ncbi:MAG: GH3 auxin-responsive promoter family protein [Acidobacteria bacterium]|nr:GH3 auxin-responsive promoter family protein [Acidobacteriota bacterium]
MARTSTGLSDRLGRFWARRRIRIPASDPRDTLFRLVARAQETRFGQEHQFKSLLKAPDLYPVFREQINPTDYADWTAWLGQRAPRDEATAAPLVNEGWPGVIDTYCLSSGTSTGRTKFIPYSQDMIRVNRRAALDLTAHLIEAGFQPLASKSLYMSGSTKLHRNVNGVLAGDMSALTKYLAPRWLDLFAMPPQRISSLPDWNQRLEATIGLFESRSDIALLSGIPIWQLTLLEHLSEKARTQIRFLVHGGMSIAPYRARMQSLLPAEVQFVEVYAASELGIGAFQWPGEQGMRFTPHYDVFYEFECENGQIIPLWEVKPGHAYQVLVTCCSGLWRYRIGDQLVFSQTDPLILSHVARDKTMSAFDEKVTEGECAEAMAKIQPTFADYSVGPDLEGRCHVWFVVTSEPLPQGWVQQLDRHLRDCNQDYDDYRSDGRIKEPQAVRISDRGAYLRRLGRDEGGQRKFPRLLSATEVQLLLDSNGP